MIIDLTVAGFLLTLGTVIAGSLWSLSRQAFRLGRAMHKLDDTLVDIKGDLETLVTTQARQDLRLQDVENYLMKETSFMLRNHR